MGKFKDEFAGLAVAAVGLGLTYITGGAAAFAGKAAFATYFTAAATTYGVASSRRAARRQRDAFNSSRQDRMLTTRSTVAPRRIVYGQDRVGGNLTFIGTSGENSQYLHLVLTLCDAVATIDDIWFEDESIGGLDEFGFVQHGSKWFKAKEEPVSNYFTHPGRNGYIDLSSPRLKRLHSVAFFDEAFEAGGESDTDGRIVGVAQYLKENVDFIISPQGTGGIGLAMLNDKGKGSRLTVSYIASGGKPLVRVYRWSGRGDREQMRHRDLENVFPNEWTSDHVGLGVAKIELRLEYDPDVFTGGLPNISALVTGRYVLDMRFGQYKPGYDIAAAVIQDYLMHEYGFSAKWEEFDAQNLASELSWCEKELTAPGEREERRYTINGTVYADRSPEQNLRDMLTSTLGGVIWSGGAWLIRCAQYRAPEITLNAEDMVEGPVAIGARQDRASVFNQVHGTFTDRSQNFQDNSYKPYRSQVYVDEDKGAEFIERMNFPFVHANRHAQRLAKLHLLKARQATRMTARFSLKALRLQPYDTAWVNLAYAGFENKVFRVTEKEFDPESMSVELSLQEDAPQIYDENFNELTNPDPAPNTKLPDPRYVPPLEGFVARTGVDTYTVLPDGTVSGHVVCTWTAVTSSSVLRGGHIEIWWKDAIDRSYRREKVAPDTTEYLLKPVTPNQQINVFALNVNGVGSKSDQVDTTINVDGRIPSNKEGGVSTGNLLVNSSFDLNGAGWRVNSGPGVPLDVVRKVDKPKSYANSALPQNFHLIQSYDVDSSTYVVHILPLKLQPGLRYCLQFSAATRDSRVWMRADFYDQNTQLIRIARTPELGPDPADPVDGSTRRRQFGFITAPDNLVQTVVSLVKAGSGGGGGFSEVRFAKPMLSIAEPGQSVPPAWQEGPPLNRHVESKQIGSTVLGLSFTGEHNLFSFPIQVLPGQRMTVHFFLNAEHTHKTTGTESSFGLTAQFLWPGSTVSLKHVIVRRFNDGFVAGNRIRTSTAEFVVQEVPPTIFPGTCEVNLFSFISGASAAQVDGGSILIEII